MMTPATRVIQLAVASWLNELGYDTFHTTDDYSEFEVHRGTREQPLAFVCYLQFGPTAVEAGGGRFTYPDCRFEYCDPAFVDLLQEYVDAARARRVPARDI